jgi:hypothetical protein
LSISLGKKGTNYLGPKMSLMVPHREWFLRFILYSLSSQTIAYKLPIYGNYKANWVLFLNQLSQWALMVFLVFYLKIFQTKYHLDYSMKTGISILLNNTNDDPLVKSTSDFIRYC